MQRSRPATTRSCLRVRVKPKTSRSCTSRPAGTLASSRPARSLAVSGWRSGTRRCGLNRDQACLSPVALPCAGTELRELLRRSSIIGAGEPDPTPSAHGARYWNVRDVGLDAGKCTLDVLRLLSDGRDVVKRRF